LPWGGRLIWRHSKIHPDAFFDLPVGMHRWTIEEKNGDDVLFENVAPGFFLEVFYSIDFIQIDNALVLKKKLLPKIKTP